MLATRGVVDPGRRKVPPIIGGRGLPSLSVGDAGERRLLRGERRGTV